VLLTKGKVNGGDHQPSHQPPFHRSQAANNTHSTTSLVRLLHRLPRLQREHSRAKKYCAAVGSAAVGGAATLSPVRVSLTGLAIKNPPEKTQKNHLKTPTKMFFFCFFFYFKFFMKIIQTFLFETDKT
jgi:hypothetical protein